jgi:hypothetical protein
LSYDVRYRLASPGAAKYTTWRYPTAWQHLTSQSVSTSVTVGAEACFEVRAIDRAGNVGDFGGRRCNSVSYDDRALQANAGVARIKSAKAMSGTLSRLTRRHATLSRDGAAGKSVALMIRRGPRQGAANVYLGAHLIGSIRFQASSWRFAIVLMPTHGYGGTIRVRSTSAKPGLVDGIGLLR